MIHFFDGQQITECREKKKKKLLPKKVEEVVMSYLQSFSARTKKEKRKNVSEMLFEKFVPVLVQ